VFAARGWCLDARRNRVQYEASGQFFRAITLARLRERIGAIRRNSIVPHTESFRTGMSFLPIHVTEFDPTLIHKKLKKMAYVALMPFVLAAEQ
jgi:hypothetical protein